MRKSLAMAFAPERRLLAAATFLLLPSVMWTHVARAQSSSADALSAASAQMRSGDFAGAMQTYEQLLHDGGVAGRAGGAATTEARDGEVHAAVALALEQKRKGDADAALATLLRARGTVPDDAELLLDLGVQEEQMHLTADADAALTEALRLRPGDATTQYALARVKMDREDMSQAVAMFRLYLAQRPDDASAHYGLGLALHRLLQDDEGAAEFERSLAMQPAQTESHYQLGMIALSEGRLNDAKHSFEAVLTRAPKHGGSLTGLGQIAIREKRYADARGYLEAAVAAAPDYAEAHRYLALVLAKMGDAEGARVQTSQAEALTAEQDRARKGRTLLKP